MTPDEGADAGPSQGGKIPVKSYVAGDTDIPGDYVYDPDGQYNAAKSPDYAGRHDYCTSSPDTGYFPTGTVDFRGPCARHDMCYDVADRVTKARCDDLFYTNLKAACADRFSSINPSRAACYGQAKAYYEAVKSKGEGRPLCQPVTPQTPRSHRMSNQNKYC